jgi:hypothetical protein
MVSKGNGPATTSDDTEPRAEIVVKTDWAAISNWEDALSHFGPGELVESAEAFGDGSTLLSSEEKDLLVGKQFIVLEFRFITDETTNREYVNVLGMTRDGGKFRFNDGSTGILQQCKAYFERTGYTGGIVCGKGLRKSDYIAELPDGTRTPATTFYFA